MLTRAYDTIMAAVQVPMIVSQNVDFNNSTIDDSVLNCKDYAGNVKTCASYSFVSGSSIGYVGGLSAGHLPFASPSETEFLPDEDESEPDYEDYEVDKDVPTGWAKASTSYALEKEYDAQTKEFVCTEKYKWQNTSGTAKTVYGVKVRGQYPTRSNYSATSVSTTKFLLCREHFPAPVVVEDQEIIQLTFTWRVGRAGLVGNTSADGKVVSFSVYSVSRDKTTSYQAGDGMTWTEWVDSDYNTDGFTVAGTVIYDDNHDVVCYEYSDDTMRTVSATKEIVAGMRYESGSDGS